MSEKNYYNILGVNKNSSPQQIKKSFRKLALKYHPDRNQGNKLAEKKFKEINEAYTILKDEKKRSLYDKYGSSAFRNGNNPGFDSSFSGFDDISDVFGDIFGDFMGKGNRSYKKRNSYGKSGKDVNYNLEITLEESYNGSTKDIHFYTFVKCVTCNSRGSLRTSNNICKFCRGTGNVRYQQGFFMIEKTCNNCSGSGIFITDPCFNCNGEGRINKEKKLSIKIPKGIEHQSKIKILNEGMAGIRGSNVGNLYINIFLKNHNFYQREGCDLHISTSIKITTAILGGYIEIININSSIFKIYIPRGTQFGTKLRIRNKGMPIINSSFHGDLYIHITILLPTNISSTQRKLLEVFDILSIGNFNRKIDDFFKNIMI